MKKFLPLMLVLLLLTACAGNKAGTEAETTAVLGQKEQVVSSQAKTNIDAQAIDKQMRQNESDMRMLILENKEMAKTLEELGSAVVESDRAIVNMIRNLEHRVNNMVANDGADGADGKPGYVVQPSAELSPEQKQEIANLKKEIAALRKELADMKSDLQAAPTTSGATVESSANGAATNEENEYEAARSEYDKRNFNTAITKLEAFKNKYPSSKLASNAVYWKGESYYAQNKLELAMQEFKNVINNYPNAQKAADSQLKIGMCQLLLGNKAEAREELNKVKNNYPNYWRMDLVNKYLDQAK